MSDESRQPPPMPPYDPAQWVPQPPPAPPRRGGGRKALIIIGIVVLGLALLGAGGYVLVKTVMAGAEKLGTQVAEPFLVHMRDGDYDAIYHDASPEFQNALTRSDFADLMATVEKRVGRPQSWKLVGYKTEAYAGTGGPSHVRSFTYDVTHERGTSAIELRFGSDNRLLYFNVNPHAK